MHKNICSEENKVKVFNMITKINEAKRFVKYIWCDCKCKFSSTHSTPHAIKIEN